MEATDEKPPSAIALRQGYEPPDLNVKGLLVFLIIFLLMAVVIHVGIWFLNEYLSGRPRDADAVKSAVPVVRQFSRPDVQPTESHNQMPWQDMADLRHAEAARFEQLGWKSDPATGSAVIPDSIVSRLAERYKAKGPAAPAATQPATGPAQAGESPTTGPAPTEGPSNLGDKP